MKRLIHNQKIVDCLINDIGICVPAQGNVDFGAWDLDAVLRSQDLFLMIDAGDIFLEIENDVIVETSIEARKCFTSVTQFCTEQVDLNVIKSANLSKMEEFILANLLNVVFKMHIEGVLLREHLQNVFVFLGCEYHMLEAYENVILSAGSVALAPKGKKEIIDTHNKGLLDVSRWGSIHEMNVVENSDLLKIDIIKGCIGESSIIFRTPKNKNWKNYDYVVCEAEGVEGMELIFVINDATAPTSRIELGNGKVELYCDLSGFTRTDIKKYGIGVKLLSDIVPCSLEVGTLFGFKKYGLHETGLLQTKSLETMLDIKEVFICNNWTIAQPLSLTMDISLDDGENWHKVQQGQFNTWVPVESWGMNNKRHLKVRYLWQILDDEKSAILDDFFVMYRVGN